MNREGTLSWRTRAITALATVTLAAVGTVVSAAPAHAIEDTFVGSGSNTLGIEYEHANSGGKRLLFLSVNTGCTASLTDVDFQIGGMPEDWSDEISSYVGLGTSPTPCWVKHFKDANFLGDSIGYDSGRPFIGDAFNDETTSIRWS